MLTVVMYHYVRPMEGSAWPRLKALELQDFIGQLDWLAENHHLIGPSDLQLALTQGAPLPPRACLPRPEMLADELDLLLREQDVADPVRLRAAHFTPNRFDSAPVAYSKRLLQHVLPPGSRSLAVETLFSRHVTTDEAGLAEELYLSSAQARDMRAAGHEFGGHGDLHLWHAQASAPELAAEITGSERALRQLGAPVANGFYCYPFGSQNETVRDAVEKAGFRIGFSVEPVTCDYSTVDPLLIPRLDTNDLPKGPA